MAETNKIRVLVVDDSILFREVISKGLSSDPNIEVVAKASDPFDARDKIIEFQPDVMTCDVQMPKMDGIEFIRRLLPQYPLPTIVVSSVSNIVFEALNAGAVEFIPKPDIQSPESTKNFISGLIKKVYIASKSKVTIMPQPIKPAKTESKGISGSKKIIAIGASTGGTEAIYNVLKHLPETVPGIVIVQHIPIVFSKMFAERLNNQTRLNVKEAQNGDYLEPGKVVIAPGNQHIIVKKIGDRYRVDFFNGDKVNGHCPSVDVMFESVAKEAKNEAVGVILTGMGYDGAKGLLSIRRNGGRTIGQDEKSCVVYGMPKVAYDIGGVEKQCPLSDIPNMILNFLK